MNLRSVEAVAQIAFEAAEHQLLPALLEDSLGAAKQALASLHGAESAGAPALRLLPGLAVEERVTAKALSAEQALGEATNLSEPIDMADPRSYASQFAVLRKASSSSRYGDVEALAAIVRNSMSADPGQFQTPLALRQVFGAPPLQRSVESASDYLERVTGMRLSPQAVRFRNHDAADGHYAMFVKSDDGVERVAYGRVLRRERLIFEPVKGKEFNWQQLNQFGRRVVAAHRLEPVAAETAESLSVSDSFLALQSASSRRSSLINPPDARGGVTRVNCIECVSTLLRNKLFGNAANGFENVLDVQARFGDSRLARTMTSDQARLFGQSYLEMASGARLEPSRPFTEAGLEPGHYALFFDTESKLPQVAYGEVFDQGGRYVYYPRTNKTLPVDFLNDRNLATFKVTPELTSAPDAAVETAANLSPEQLQGGKYRLPVERGTNVDFEGTVVRLMRFRAGKSSAVHQNFMLEAETGTQLRIVHNISSSSGIVPLQRGSHVSVRGQYAVNDYGQGLLHWTHKSGPNSDGLYGWVQVDGKRYW